MFSNLLVKSVQIGEKIFHVLCDVSANVEDIEKFGIEMIKVANDIRKAIIDSEKTQEEQKENPETEEKSEIKQED